jgi:hypothetical protein
MYVSMEIERRKEIEINDTVKEGNCTNVALIREQRGSNTPVAIAQVYHREITPTVIIFPITIQYPETKCDGNTRPVCNTSCRILVQQARVAALTATVRSQM